jgi:hypothetical protein
VCIYITAYIVFSGSLQQQLEQVVLAEPTLQVSSCCWQACHQAAWCPSLLLSGFLYKNSGPVDKRHGEWLEVLAVTPDDPEALPPAITLQVGAPC